MREGLSDELSDCQTEKCGEQFPSSSVLPCGDVVADSRPHSLTRTVHSQRLNEDAESGWGAHLQDLTAARPWTEQEDCSYVNILEMKAVQLAFKYLLASDHGGIRSLDE